MLNTDSNCQGTAQGGGFDTWDQQRKAEKLQELQDTVDQFLEDYGLADNIDVLNTLLLSIFPHNEPDMPPVEWSAKFILDCTYRIGNIIMLLAKLYELRRTDLYTRAV